MNVISRSFSFDSPSWSSASMANLFTRGISVVTPPTLPLKIDNQAMAIEYVPRFFSAKYMTYHRVDFLSDIIISLYEIGDLGYISLPTNSPPFYHRIIVMLMHR